MAVEHRRAEWLLAGAWASTVVRVLVVLCAASLVLSIGLAWTYLNARHRALTAAKDRVQGEAVRAARVIDTELQRLPVLVRALAADVSAGRVPKAQLPERLKASLDVTPQLHAIGAAYVPYAYDGQLRLRAPMYRRQGDATELVDLDSLYDYTQGDHDWYRAPLTAGPSWSEPAISDLSPAPVVEFSAAFTDGPLQGQTPAGVIHAAMSLSEVDDLIRSLDLGEYGYGFLVSRKGFVISHPFADAYVAARGNPDAAAKRMFEAVRGGQHAVVEDATDPITGEPSWIFSETVPATGWTVGVVFFQQESANSRMFRRQQIRLTVSVLVLAALLLGLGLRLVYRGNVQTLWFGVLAWCGLLALGIGVLWIEGYGTPSSDAAADTIFANTASARQFVLKTTRAALKRRGGLLPVYVPTGVFVQTLEIAGPNNIAVSGYIWQKYPKTLPESIQRGIVLPDAADRQITEAYRRTEGDVETIGWYVKATIRQTFNYARYPLDQQDFRLRIWPRDLDKNVTLVPDLDSYRIIHPLSRFGLEKGFTLPGWKVERTQFSNRPRERNTTFGVAMGEADSVNELYFNIILNREILEPVFSSLLPLAVSGFMVFALLLAVKESTRASVVQILAAYSALFFVVILSELDLRRKLPSSSILYIEYFYFVMYGAILSVALITLTNTWTGFFPRIERREHLLPKLLFWPLILVALLAATLAVFY